MNTSLDSHQALRQSLRREMKIKRQQLSPIAQQQASQAIIAPALDLIARYQAQHIAFYLPFNGEISPLALMEILHKQGKSLYLPVVHPFSFGNLLFIAYEPNDEWIIHSLGMQEPKLDVRKVLPLNELDMIFTPLVACDKHNGRLGYGGGFYDRTLSQSSAISVGLAHCCQQVEKLPLAAWDEPLDHLILG